LAVVRKPEGIDERPEQLRPAVVRGVGVTASERHLADLAEKSFLNLWSYPSPFRDQRTGGKGDGKELCDLLVVCGRFIIIFSEKTIHWPNGDVSVAWSRWARSAIRDAAKQSAGAERWIKEHPDRVFLDRGCSQPFPIDFPSEDVRIFHRVVVVNGVADACHKHSTGHAGSLSIKPRIKGAQHWTGSANELEPFAVGDVDPSGSFVHVLDEVALDVLMRELDTVRDFTDYLEKRAAFIRSDRLKVARGEKNLLAYYAIRVNEDGDHDFVFDTTGEQIVIDADRYRRWTNDPRYHAKKEADQVSYLWDRLINVFTAHMLAGTSITIDGFEFEFRKNELGVRHMALVSRYLRRSHSEAIDGALQIGMERDRFFRLMMAAPESKESDTAFFVLTFKYKDWMDKDGGYEAYRRVRANFSIVYAKGVLERYSHLKRIIGIALEPPNQGRGSSEDLIYAEQADWSEEDRAAIRYDCERAGVLQGTPNERQVAALEYPELETIVIELDGERFKPQRSGHQHLNRRERRAIKAKSRKAGKLRT
jgi:hypothetical protein